MSDDGAARMMLEIWERQHPEWRTWDEERLKAETLIFIAEHGGVGPDSPTRGFRGFRIV
jgi:hypothetical protein